MVGPDALKWSWLLLALGLLLIVDARLNWGIFSSRRDPISKRNLPYNSFDRVLRVFFGIMMAATGATGLAYLAFAQLNPY